MVRPSLSESLRITVAGQRMIQALALTYVVQANSRGAVYEGNADMAIALEARRLARSWR
jgi:hypothetical protein